MSTTIIPTTTHHTTNAISNDTAELVAYLANLRTVGKLTPCVGKLVAALAVSSDTGNVTQWASYGAASARAKGCVRLAKAFDEFLNT